MNQRTDTCPECGTTRTELVVVPGRFHCPRCEAAGPGPSFVVPAGVQLSIDTERSTEA